MPDRKLWQPANPADGFLTSQDWIDIGIGGKLTARELEVAVLLFDGHSRARIARKLKLSTETVRVYIDRLYHKLRVTGNIGFVLRVVRVHLALSKNWGMSHKDVTCDGQRRRYDRWLNSQ